MEWCGVQTWGFVDSGGLGGFVVPGFWIGRAGAVSGAKTKPFCRYNVGI